MAPVTIHMRFPVAILVVNSVMITSSFIFVILRLWARRIKRTSLQISDYIILIAWVLTFGLLIAENYSVTKGGVGQSQDTVSFAEETFALKMFDVFGTIAIPAVATTRISVIFFFIKIFPNRKFHWAAYIMIGMNISQSLAYIIATLAACEPFAFQWDKTIRGGHCINTSIYYTSQAVVGVALDIMVVILPMPMLWGLQMKARKKITLSLLFGLGTLICIISIIRLVKNTDAKSMATDFPGYAGQVILLATLETNLSIINACLPIMQPVLTRVSTKVRLVLTSSSSTLAEGRSKPPQREVRFKGSDDAKFRRLHDTIYPLPFDGTTQLSYGVGTTIDIEGERTSDSTDVEMNELRNIEQEPVKPESANKSLRCGTWL